MSQYLDSQASLAEDLATNEAISDSLFVDDTQSLYDEAPPATPAPGLTRKRPLPPPSDEPSLKRTGPKRMNWTPDMTATLITWFVECFREGLFKGSKAKTSTPAWEAVTARARERWPEYADRLSVLMIRKKYDTERTRFTVWKAWVEKSGNSCDPDNGRCVVDTEDERWVQFLNVRGGPRRCGWLASGTALGNVAEYRELWDRDYAKGEHISRPGGGTEEGSAGESRPELALDIFNSVEGESEGEEEVVAGGGAASFHARPLVTSSEQRLLPGTPARPAGRGITNEQWHRRVTDPDHSPASFVEPEEVDVARGRARRREPEPSSDRPSASPAPSLFGQTEECYALASAVRELAKSLAPVDPVGDAISDFSTRYKEEFRGDRRSFFAILKILREPDEAKTWVSLDEESRQMYLEELKCRTEG